MAQNLSRNYIVRVKTPNADEWTPIPSDMIEYESYHIEPSQALDLDSYRNERGYLIRNVLEHTATKIEFNTRRCTDAQWATVWDVISGGFGYGNTAPQERKLRIQYWDPYTDTNKKATCYVPDIELHIRNVDFEKKIINYEPIRIAFIEY